MKAHWITENGETEFCGMMPSQQGYIRLRIDETLGLDISGEQAHSLLNQIAWPALPDEFDDGSVLYFDEGEFKTLFMPPVCLSLTAWHVESLQAELERVLAMESV